MLPLPFNSSLYRHENEEPFLHLNKSSAFCSQFENGQWYCYVLVVLLSLALPVGIVGNVAALLSYTCFRRADTPGTVFLLNLALCDSALLLMLPFTIYYSLQRPHLASIQTYCQFKKIFFTVNVYGSILFLTLISFDRYAGVVHPVGSLRWWNLGKARLCAGLTWLLLLLSTVPELFVTFAVRRPGNITVCMDHIQGPFVYVKTISVARTLVGFILPFSLMLALYAQVVRVLRGLPGGGKPGPRGRAGSRRSVGKPLLLITAALLVFVVSFVPYHVMIMVLVILRVRGQVTPENVGVLYASYEFFQTMCSVSSCLDPVLYILASDTFLRRLQSLRKGRGRGGPPCVGLACRASRRVGVEG